MITPWERVEPIGEIAWRDVRRRMIFDAGKWDPHVGDVEVISRYALVLRPEAWEEIVRTAEALAAETIALERSLLSRPDLHESLGLPGAIRRASRRASSRPPRAIARQIRFDFHWTRDGWRVSEANTDVPGGYLESSALPRLCEALVGGARAAGDPVEALCRAVDPWTNGMPVALVHATAYTDDRQVMLSFANEFSRRGIRAELLSPDHLRWRDGRALSAAPWCEGAVGAIVRFFPGEWLANLSRRGRWRHFFADSTTPMSNPATALLTQSKRLPLIWDRLGAPIERWRAVLPETRDPRDAPSRDQDEWVLKPALGRVGEAIGMTGVTAAKEMLAIRRAAGRQPTRWVAQRRFETIRVSTPVGDVFPCLGVFTIDGSVAGIYGRASTTQIVDQHAMDVAVLVGSAAPSPAIRKESARGCIQRV